MQRPIMDPLFLQDEPDPPKPRMKPNWRAIRTILRGIGWCVKGLFSSPFRQPRRRRRHADDERLLARLCREAVSRLVFLPLLLAVVVAVLVYCGTHPPALTPGLSPMSVGLYFDAVDFISEDGTPLRGWLVPAIDARRVLDGDDRLFRRKHPGIVLAHDYGKNPSQLLPLLPALHDAGFDILVVGLRGIGLGKPVGQTFGANESRDVAAAVQVLRGNPSVDPNRVAVLGVGSGGNAVLLAAERDPRIAAVVLADPLADSSQAIERYVGPNRWPFGWVQNCCRWGWELGFRVGPDEIDRERLETTRSAQNTLGADNVLGTDGGLAPAFIRAAVDFCADRLGAEGRPVASADSP